MKLQEQKTDSEELREDENNAIKTYGFEDNIHNCETPSENLIILDGSDKECDNTNTRVNKSACKNRKVPKGKKLKNKVIIC